MPENLRKRPRDPAQLAKLMIDIASGEVERIASLRQMNAAISKLKGATHRSRRSDRGDMKKTPQKREP
jgi:hypothetical protein